jgi:hypothetical protein
MLGEAPSCSASAECEFRRERTPVGDAKSELNARRAFEKEREEGTVLEGAADGRSSALPPPCGGCGASRCA